MGAGIMFKLLKGLGFISNREKLERNSLFVNLLSPLKTFFKLILLKYCYSSFLLEPLNLRFIRAYLWRLIGCKIGKNVQIGHSVSLDYGSANLVTIEDNVIITNSCILLCHKRDVSNYHVGDDSRELPYKYGEINLMKGCQIGMGSIIMPGVTIGEGAIIGAKSVVTKNVPPWVVAVGSPLKIIKQMPQRLDKD